MNQISVTPANFPNLFALTALLTESKGYIPLLRLLTYYSSPGKQLTVHTPVEGAVKSLEVPYG